MDRVYLDNAATTPLSNAALEAMREALEVVWGNPSSIHAEGRTARKLTDTARRQVAAALGAKPQEICFTAGGSESDNWAIKGAAFARRMKGDHIITTQVEHHAVLHTCRWLEKQGFRVTYLPVGKDGRVDPEAVRRAMTKETILVSVMMANNEVGTLMPIPEIAAIAHEGGALMHTDAVQAVGSVPVDVNTLGIDLLSLSGHKFHGPKGVGALWIRNGVFIDNLIDGGAQERGKRAGTENLPGIAGMAAALTEAVGALEEHTAHVLALRERLRLGILERIPGAAVNGSLEHRLPGNLNISFDRVEGEALLLRLDLAGVAASSGSACTSGSLDPSHVLMALGLTREAAAGSLRMTVGSQNTEAEIDRVLDILPGIVQNLRDLTAGVFTQPVCPVK